MAKRPAHPADLDARRRPARAWQPRLFPELVEPLDSADPARSAAGRDGRARCDWLRRRRPPVLRIDLHEARPQLTPEVEAWLAGLGNAETRRAYRRDALFLMRRLGLDTEPKLVCLERRDAVRYRDLLQALMSAGGCSVGLARRRMAAALSLYDHLQRQYLVLLNPFAKLRRPRQAGGDGQALRRHPACGRIGCPLAVPVAANAATSQAPRRRSRAAVDEPLQLKLW